jgi:hypothetical protein
MTGVEILATEQVAVAFGLDWVLFALLGILFSILFGGLAWCLAAESNFSELGISISVCVGIAVALVLAAFISEVSETGAPTEFETHYKVTISDEVSMKEFLERYEIVDQDGKIFTVREVE